MSRHGWRSSSAGAWRACARSLRMTPRCGGRRTPRRTRWTTRTHTRTSTHSIERVPAFTFIQAMLASHHWRLRHAGLVEIASIAEGTNKSYSKTANSGCVGVRSHLSSRLGAHPLSLSASLSGCRTTDVRATRLVRHHQQRDCQVLVGTAQRLNHATPNFFPRDDAIPCRRSA